jgi:hypothetical protein
MSKTRIADKNIRNASLVRIDSSSSVFRVANPSLMSGVENVALVRPTCKTISEIMSPADFWMHLLGERRDGPGLISFSLDDRRKKHADATNSKQHPFGC